MPYDQNSPTGKSLFERHIELLGRVEDLERQMQGVRKDWEFADYESPVVKPQEVIMAGEDPQDFVPDILTPPQIEFGKPTAPVTTDVATVTLQPCDQGGTSFANAATVTVYVANDRQTQETSGRGWTTSTILSFIRFMPWVAGSPNKEGVLIGEPKASDFGLVDADDPMELDGRLYTNQQISSWADLEPTLALTARDWRGRVLHVSIYRVTGSGYSGEDPSWLETDIQHFRLTHGHGTPGTGSWVAQTADAPFRLLTTSNNFTHYISRHNQADPGFELQMEGIYGYLQYKVTNATPTAYDFRIHIHSGAKIVAADRVELIPPA